MTHTIARGLEGVVLTETRTSRVDGDRGELVIGGFAVCELARRARFEEAVFLLWHDRLPTRSELDLFESRLARERDLPEPTLALLRAFADARQGPMDALRAGAASLSLSDPAPSSDVSVAAEVARAFSLVARIPVLVAAYARLSSGDAPLAPRPDLGHVASYLWLLEGRDPHPERVRALESYLVTAIDHGMNASTFTARVVTSTRSDLISAATAAIGALKGPAHGGAPGPALDMVFEIRARAAASGRTLEEEAERFLRAALAAGERIMGFGHRVYRVRDPRADVLADTAERLFARGADPRLYADALRVEHVVLRVLEELRPGRRIQTNVEFYTALVLHGLGLDSALFSPTFAVGRIGGWTAHALEQARENRLIRPHVAYTGEDGRRWIPAEARS